MILFLIIISPSYDIFFLFFIYNFKVILIINNYNNCNNNMKEKKKELETSCSITVFLQTHLHIICKFNCFFPHHNRPLSSSSYTYFYYFCYYYVIHIHVSFSVSLWFSLLFIISIPFFDFFIVFG